ncbi:hypothetical protein GQ457_06G015750 [Hibiscus cannabinus]
MFALKVGYAFLTYHGLTGFTALEGYFDDVGSILERFDDVWGIRLGLISQSKLESKWLWILPYIASSGKARKQGGSSKTFVQVRFLFLQFWCRVSVPYQWYRYPNPTLEFGYRYLLGRVSVPLVMHQVSIPEQGYRYPLVISPGIGTKGGYQYPSSPLGLEYRYWLPSTDTSCLKTVFGTP